MTIRERRAQSVREDEEEDNSVKNCQSATLVAITLFKLTRFLYFNLPTLALFQLSFTSERQRKKGS